MGGRGRQRLPQKTETHPERPALIFQRCHRSFQPFGLAIQALLRRCNAPLQGGQLPAASCQALLVSLDLPPPRRQAVLLARSSFLPLCSALLLLRHQGIEAGVQLLPIGVQLFALQQAMWLWSVCLRMSEVLLAGRNEQGSVGCQKMALVQA